METHIYNVLESDEDHMEVFCPICFRHVIVYFEPYSRDIMAYGDDRATHRVGVSLELEIDVEERSEPNAI